MFVHHMLFSLRGLNMLSMNTQGSAQLWWKRYGYEGHCPVYVRSLNCM